MKTCQGVGLVLAGLLGMALPAVSAAAVFERVSVSSDEVEGNGGSVAPRVSADGRYVVFESRAADLVAGDTNEEKDIFVRDRLTGETARVSVASDGTQANHRSKQADISADGRVIAFMSRAGNLGGAELSKHNFEVYVHDRDSGRTTCVSLDRDGKPADGGAYDPVLSANGRFVAFSTSAALVPEDTNRMSDVYVHDRRSGKTARVSVAGDGREGYRSSFGAAISADGRLVAFQSYASNLVTGDTNDDVDIFVHDRKSRKTTRVSVSSTGAQGGMNYNYYSGVGRPTISADGRYVAFSSVFEDLIAGDTNDGADVFVHDRKRGTTTRASVGSDGRENTGFSYSPRISPDGRYVTFGSYTGSLVPGDKINRSDTYMHDRRTGATSRVLTGIGGGSVGGLSVDARFVAFTDRINALVADDNNGVNDVFVYDRLVQTALSGDLQVSQVASHEPVNLGGSYSYTITVANRGPTSADAVTLQDIVSDHLVVTAVTPSQGSCRRGVLTLCRLGTLEAGANATVTVTVTAQYDGTARNQINVSSPSSDSDPFNNSSVTTTTVLP